MKQGITIVTWEGGRDQALNLIYSMKNVTYPILVVINKGINTTWMDSFIGIQTIKLEEDCFELGAIEATLKYTDWDEFILLQDTFEILDIGVFDLLFNNYPNKTVAYNPHFQMYFGKFRRKTLNKIQIPQVRTKLDAIKQEEIFIVNLAAIDKPEIFNNDFTDEAFKGNYEYRWGRKNLVLKDQYLIKRKGIWDIRQIIG